MRSMAASSISSSSPSPLAPPRPLDATSPSTPSTYCGCAWRRQCATTLRTSSSPTHAPWMRRGTFEEATASSMSPWPMRRSAPGWSRMTRLSASDDTANASREGTLALMTPVMTSTDGRWVAITRCRPTARAICAIRQMASSTSRAATIMRSLSSSTTTRMNGRRSWARSEPGSGCSSPRSYAAL